MPSSVRCTNFSFEIQLPSVQCKPVNTSNHAINLQHIRLGPELKLISHRH
jgi:hypothetical protein